jgi:hypothetical protein|tara:strand:- start:8 stop:331 length:324 start_codon:yes stop_codon:yes gene_type:complete
MRAGLAGRASDVADARAAKGSPRRALDANPTNPCEEDDAAGRPRDRRQQGATGALVRIAVAMSVAAADRRLEARTRKAGGGGAREAGAPSVVVVDARVCCVANVPET